MLKESYHIQEEIIEWRRDFHMHPELGFQEVRTSNRVAEELEKLGAYRSIVEYMLQTKQINDKVLMAVIEDFNKTFIKTDDEYNASPLGFRSRPEQLTGFIQGYMVRSTSVE